MGQLGQLIVRCALLATAGVCGALLAPTTVTHAQAALAATSVAQDRLPPDARLTLRPAPGLEAVATKIARVLTLRGDTRVEIGSAPPPELLEAVSAGHIALAREGGSIHLVMGAAMGESFEARVGLPSDGQVDVRTLALAIEALRDRAIAARERRERASRREHIADQSQAALPVADAVEPEPATEQAPLPEPQPQPAPLTQRRTPSQKPALVLPKSSNRDEGSLLPRPEPQDKEALKVKPRLYLSLYGGASNESTSLRTGIGTGGGLCVLGQCLLLGIEYPLPISLEAGADDVRYRYPTFSCSFYSHPVQWGRFTPAISLGLLSRVGHFERDMGIKDYRPGLDTDLGVRGTIQGAYQVFDAVEAVAEGGIDYALDRWQFGHGDSLAFRGSRVAPWLQAGIRIRPE